MVTQKPGALIETFPSFIEIMARVVYSTEGREQSRITLECMQ